ncbi:UNVERIFIED_CONTAM: hypothetical protein Slati_0108100 [Sesamum latifolium]|uniref:Reverse transcriptase zinc-binding domain-containing protein n=1 Tax=Sesamum latifolium TaxID=2727402 RepID=A0AAW2Y8V3_9LAMI
MITKAWSSVHTVLPHNLLLDKIPAASLQLGQWNKDGFGNIRCKTKELNEEICALQKGDISTEAKARIEANERHVRKEIRKIQDENGTKVNDKEGIQKVILQYFRSIFASTNPTTEAMEEVLECLECHVTPAMNETFLHPFTSEEIAIAMKQMYPFKSPGPDDFLNNGLFTPLVNYTHIVLIPKCPNPTDMSHFRPISLCNVLYKLASKVIANRIKPFLDWIISTSQAAFVPGQLIIDNILVAYELNHFIKHKNRVWIFMSGMGTSTRRSFVSIPLSFVCRNVLVPWSLDGMWHSDQRLALSSIIGVDVVPRHEKYLGLPTIVGRSKRELFEGIKNRIWNKIHSWSAKKLSQVGCAVLVRTVLQTIPIYAMSCFRMPNHFLGELESIMGDFFWQGVNEAKTHWLAWTKLCKPKALGELGLQRLGEYNSALLAKQAWRIALGLGTVLHQRCAHDVLPTAMKLKQRGILSSEECVSCLADQEDALHVLFFCNFSRLTWVISGLPWRALHATSTSLEVWFRRVQNDLERAEWDLFLTVCWAIWWACN